MADTRNGIVQVYTGNGKGKTTAAWGQALRAVGRGWKVAVVRFLKPDPSGEDAVAERLSPDVTLFGRTSPYDPTVDQRENTVLRDESRGSFEQAASIVKSGEYDLVVLDEINVVLHYGFVSAREFLDALAERPSHVEVVATGRYAPEELVQAADLVTEMRDIKHPAKLGLAARRGVEY